MNYQKEGDRVEIHCPTEAELQTEPQVNVPCTVDGCHKTFSTSAARNIHIIQTHKIYKDEDEWKRFNRYHQKSLSKVTKHFYCPVQTCNRSIEWEKPFTRLSLLKQHYNILHAEKKFQCQKCDKGFSTQRQRANHERDCGKLFSCTCGEKHNSVAALYMHAKRKHHVLPEEFKSKRRKHEQTVERYVLVIPVPFSSSQDLKKTILEPVPLLPHPSTFVPISEVRPSMTSNSSERDMVIPATVIPSTVRAPHLDAVAGSNAGAVMENPNSATTSTQTDESGVRGPHKRDTSNSYAQTAHSCFPSFTPMMSGPRTFKRHKKTLAIQTHMDWPLARLSSQVANIETQTLGGEGTTAQTQTLMDSWTQPGCMPPQSQAAPTVLSVFSNSIPYSSCSQQTTASYAPLDPRSCSSALNFCLDSSEAPVSYGPIRQISQLGTNSTQTPWTVVAVSNSQSPGVETQAINTTSSLLPPNEVLTQTDLSFQDMLEYNTSETQTFANVSDAMTETRVAPADQASKAVTESFEMSMENPDTVPPPPPPLPPPPPPDVETTGLDLLFLASTEHRAHLDLPRMDDSLCCQQTQTGLGTDIDHRETQTVWDWSLDEFSFLDQHTQTAQTFSRGGENPGVAESDQFCQTGMGIYSQFAFSNTETQTVSVFDLEMFGNSISVQTDPGSSLLGADSLSNVSTQAHIQSSPQDMVCANVQTESMNSEQIRSRQLSSNQLASSHTQTSLWEDIESIMRSDNFTQTQIS